MISLLNFIDTGFIITLGLLILVSGAIMLYCYRRLNLLENSIIEHGKILQNFIVNYNNQLLVGQKVLSNSKEVNNVNNVNIENIENIENNSENMNNENKIVVSDDDNDSVSDSDSDNNENSSESENEEISSDESENEENNKQEELKLEPNEVLENNNETDPFLNNLPIDLKQLDLKLDSKIINIESFENETNDKTTNEKKNYSRMKVDELRSLVVTKNLTSNEDAQIMKKNDLLKLLQ